MLPSLTYLKLSAAEIEKLQELETKMPPDESGAPSQLAKMSQALNESFAPLDVGDLAEEENVWISGLIQNSLQQDTPLSFSALFLVHNALVLVGLRRAHNEQLKAQSMHSPFIYTLY